MTQHKVLLAKVAGLGLILVLTCNLAGVLAAAAQDADDTSCRMCHVEEAKAWEASSHARSLKELDLKDQCLDCHSAENFLSRYYKLPQKVSVETARFTVNCKVCHTSHEERKGPEDSLRMPAQELCIQCHAMGKLSLTQKPVHNQREMLAGTGGYGIGSGTLPGPMAELGISCVHCHMPMVIPAPGDPGAKPYRTHNFRLIKPESQGADGCTYCHNNFRPSFLLKDIDQKQKEVEMRLEMLEELLEAKKGYAHVAEYQQARFNYEFIQNDRSKGYHNPIYTSLLLDKAIETLQEMK